MSTVQQASTDFQVDSPSIKDTRTFRIWTEIRSITPDILKVIGRGRLGKFISLSLSLAETQWNDIPC